MSEESIRRAQPAGILLAEDDFQMRSLLELSLRRAGYVVTACRDGLDLLDHLTPFILHDEPLDFQLIITDIRMPLISGLDILEGLPWSASLPPIILITAFGDKETHDKARELGVVSILDKPFEMDDLLREVRRAVATRPCASRSAAEEEA